MHEIAGDRNNLNVAPKGQNVGQRIAKNMRIAGSGLYSYHRSELDLYGLTPIPEQYKDKQVFNIYRPPEVLEKHRDMFARIPIITGSHVLVDKDNAKRLAVGITGDTVDTEIDPRDGELYLYTTGTIITGDGIQAYDNGAQLSCGYIPTTKWESGTHKGVEYQAVLTGFQDVNHLLMCKTARGGPQCMFMDSLDNSSPLEKFVLYHDGGRKSMGILDRLFSKRVKLAGDSALVDELLQSIGIGADPKVQVPKIRQVTKHLAGDDAKVFGEYLNELEKASGEEPETMKRAVDIVSDFYRTKLVGDAEAEPEKTEDPPAEEKKEEPASGDQKEGSCDKCHKEPCECQGEAAGDSFDMSRIEQMITDIVTSQMESLKHDLQETRVKASAGDASAVMTATDTAAEAEASTLLKSWLS